MQHSITKMQENREKIVGSVRDLSQAQLDFQPAPESWSIGQIAEHVALSERGLMDIVQSLFQKPGAPKLLRIGYDQLPLIIKGIPNDIARLSFEMLQPFSFLTRFTPNAIVQFMLANPIIKAQAAPRSIPAHGKARGDLAAFLAQVRKSTLQFLETVKDKDLAQYHWVHPLLGYQDLYGMLGMIASHDHRHIQQIEAVRKDPHFPD